MRGSLGRRASSSKVFTEGLQGNVVKPSSLSVKTSITQECKGHGDMAGPVTTIHTDGDDCDDDPILYLRDKESLVDEESNYNGFMFSKPFENNSQNPQLRVARIACRRTLISPPKVEIQQQKAPLVAEDENYGMKLLNDMYWYLLRDCGFDPMFGLCDEEDEVHETKDSPSSIKNKAEHANGSKADEDANEEEYRVIRSSASISSSRHHENHDEEALESVNRRISDLLEQHAIKNNKDKGSPRGVLDEVDSFLALDNVRKGADEERQFRRESPSVVRNLF